MHEFTDEGLATHDRDIQAQALREVARLNALLDELEVERERLKNDCGYLADKVLERSAAALAPEGRVRLMTVPHDGHEPEATCPACPHGRGGEGA